MPAILPTAELITRAPPDALAWSRLLEPASLPVLPETAAVVEELRAIEDLVDAHQIAESIGGDPLMTLKLLAHVAQLRRPGANDSWRGEVETVTEALVLLGIGPFFRVFGQQDTIDHVLGGQPEALTGLQCVLQRAKRAAAFAIGFAAHRLDHDAAVIHEAALLHDFAEWLIWLRAPSLALDIKRRQDADPTLRSVAVQLDVLGASLAELQQLLMKQWRLPALLRRISDDSESEDVQVRNVQLAVRLARHSAHGWDNPALPDDLVEIGRLLQLGAEPTLHLVRDIDSESDSDFTA